MKTRSKELVKIYKKTNNLFKVIYIHNKTYKKKLCNSLLGAIDYSVKRLGADRGEVYLSITL